MTIAFSRLGKPLFSTRIIKNDTNPIFEETAVILLDTNTLRTREKLSLQLWDSDRASADDLQGSIQVDIFELMRQKNRVSRFQDVIFADDKVHAGGKLEFTIGYFEKVAPNEEMRTDGEDPLIPEDIKDYPEMRDKREIALSELEDAVLHCPPDPEYPSGILSIQIHEVTDLQLQTQGKETTGNREGEKGQDDARTEEEEGEDLPSAYCTLLAVYPRQIVKILIRFLDR